MRVWVHTVAYAEGSTMTTRCEDCGWEWPLAEPPPEEAECDNCGGWLIDLTELELTFDPWDQ